LFLSEALQAVPLKIQGPHLLDPQGRIVLLRGINGAGHAKVPPFVSFRTPEELDPLPGWGFNTLRLLFTWEAYEPKPGENFEIISYTDGVTVEGRRRSKRAIMKLYSELRGRGAGIWDVLPANDDRTIMWIRQDVA
jgi:hypothetical protein